jgi:hypothetical protein
MQALAIKNRIQANLRGRKFELDRLNRTYNQVSASGMYSPCWLNEHRLLIIDIERHLQDHIQSQAARHEPNLNNLVKQFNGLCDDLSDLI